MKRITTRVLAVTLALAAVPGLAAFAADETPAAQGIAVQLDGENMTFTDAAPVAREGRTFLPFRAVFEAMGATVSNDGAAITAVRDGRTVAMTVGDLKITVTDKDGKTTVVTSDVAPYVDAASWRTYVPVRAAAEALGYTVGWDDDAQTVLLLDAAKLVSAATEGRQYSLMEKYADYAAKFNTGKWAVSGDLKASVAMDLGALGADASMKDQKIDPMTITGAYTGLTEGADKVQMDLNMKMDMVKFLASMEALAGQPAAGDKAEPTAEEKAAAEQQAAMLKSLAEQGVTVDVRGDLTSGMFYLNMSGDALNTMLNTDGSTWYSMDLGSMLEQSGMDLSSLMSAARDMDVQTLADSYLSMLVLNDVGDYALIKSTLGQIAAAVADDAFTKTGGDYTAGVVMDQSGLKTTMGITLNTSGDKVVGYSMDMGMAAEGVAMKMTAAIDKTDKMTANMTMDMAGISMTMDMTGAYKATDKTPETEPPKGADVTAIWAGVTGAEQLPAPEQRGTNGGGVQGGNP